jgi:hypothetical protein
MAPAAAPHTLQVRRQSTQSRLIKSRSHAFKDACRQTANCREVKLPACIAGKKNGIGALPCRAGSDSALAVPCRQRLSTCRHCNVSPAAGRLVAACRTGLLASRGCDRRVYQTRVVTHGWSPGCNPGWLTGWRSWQLNDNVEGLHRSVHPPARIHGTFTCAQLHGHVRRTQFQPSAASGCETGLSLFRFRVSTPSAPD